MWPPNPEIGIGVNLVNITVNLVQKESNGTPNAYSVWQPHAVFL